ncbi:hypothetical protein ACN47E_001961 [Coniothyrium glycines]
MASNASRRAVSNSEEANVHKETQPNGEQNTATRYRQDTSLTEQSKPGDKKEKQPNIIKRAWTKLDLDVGTFLMMCKAALPPTIALAMYQADSVAQTFSTSGYLVAIMSILGFCIMPRAKFLQTMTLNVIGTCLASAMAMLMVWSGVKARQHTTPADAPQSRYNSSQSAVLGVWLFFNIYAVNAVKAKFPQLAFPTIIYAIQINVAATNGFLFQTVPQCEAFVKTLLQAFLTGFAIATGVSLFILPVSCRKVVMMQVTGYVGLLRGALGSHKAYIHSLEGGDMFTQTHTPENEADEKTKAQTKPEVEAIKKTTRALQELHGQLTADLPFAEREIAYGKLTPDDMEGIFKNLRAIMQPILGLSSVMDLFERGAEINHWDGGADEDEGERRKAVSEWNELFTYVREPMDGIFQALDDAFNHISLRLQLVEAPKKKKGQNQGDAEAKGDSVKPGDEEFVQYFEGQKNKFFSIKEPTLRHWLESKGIKLRDDYFTNPASLDEDNLELLPSVTTRRRDQRQLYMVLYVMFLLNSISRATLDFIKFADEHALATKKSKFIWPGGRRFKKWIKSIFQDQDTNHENETTIAGFDRQNTKVYLGAAFRSKKDPEHLPPKNSWEKFGNLIRSVSHFLRSPESSFGFRAACATMSVGIIAFVRPTQTFFVEQRLVWSLIMIAISMTPTAGQSTFQFCLRILGTVIAMIISFLIWYIPDEHTAGILVFVFVFVAIGFYIPLKRMDIVIAGIISVVTAVLIVGYELQVRKIGVEASIAGTGQPAYPIYLLGPYRLATVAGGLAVAFFWTLFPYPITEHSALRQQLGGALYLSANSYSIMHEQVMARIRGDAGDEENDEESPGYQLMKARNKVFAKQMLALQGLKMHAGFVKWEFPLGGKFPSEEYGRITQIVESVANYTALLGFASEAFTRQAVNAPAVDPSSPTAPSELQGQESSRHWFDDFRRIISSSQVTSHEITSLLSLLSSSISNGQPLPPYLHAPSGYHLGQKLEFVDPEMLSLRHIAEPGYAAFAVMTICTRCIHMDVGRLLESVKKLVGELDFSFHVVSTSDGSSTSSEETLGRATTWRSGKQD